MLGIYSYCRTSWLRFLFFFIKGEIDNFENAHNFFSYGAIRQFKEIFRKQGVNVLAASLPLFLFLK